MGKDDKYDLIVVGGGIYGVFMALEASLRGLKVLILERETWGNATTGGWLRILHGGLRYLQTMDLPRFYESVRERRWYMRLFPDLVRPLPCVMPLYTSHSHSALVMRAALMANDLLSTHRNRHVPESVHLPGGRILNAEDVGRSLPFVEKTGLRAGALWYDAMAFEPERLLLSLLAWAQELGCEAREYMEAVKVLKQGGAAVGVEAVSAGGSRHRFHAPVVVNMAGHWSLQFARSAGYDLGRLRGLSWAWNVLFDVPYQTRFAAAIAARRPGAQTFFVVPWNGRALVGTGHAPVPEGAESSSVPAEQIDQFVAHVSEAAPGLGLSRSNILKVLEGRLPVSPSDPHRLSSRPLVEDHSEHGCRGMYTVWGIKYTTARAVARQVLNLAFGSGLAATVIYRRPVPERDRQDS